MKKRTSLQVEDRLRGLVEGHYRAEGYEVWGVNRTRAFHAAKDIFGCFDFLAARGHLLIFAQVTVIDRHADHRRKIIDLFARPAQVELACAELWSYHHGKQAFKVERWVYTRRQAMLWVAIEGL